MENTNFNRSVNGRFSLIRTLRHRLLPPPQKEPLWLSARQPRDYVTLLFWILFAPAKLKSYKRRLNNNGRYQLRQLGGWLASTLIWGTMLLWLIGLWGIGVAQLHWVVGVLLVVGLLVAWQTNGRWLPSTSAKASSLAPFLAIVISIATSALTLGLAPGSPPPTLLGIVAGYAALLIMMLALAVVNVLKLAVGDSVVTVVSIIFGGSIVMASVLNGFIGVPFDILLILTAVFLPSIIEQRYVEAEAENPFKQL